MSDSTTQFDVIVVGAGAAGLSAATVLGRSRRSVLVIDAGEPRNAPAAGVHNFLTRDGIAPLELARLGRVEAEGYGATFVDGRAEMAEKVDGGFRVITQDGRAFTARRLIAATGAIDELPDVDGLTERWGRDVVHCPYCHGWEVRDQRIVVLATSAFAWHGASMFRQLSDRVTVLQHTAPAPEDEQREQFAAMSVPVIDDTATRVLVEEDRIVGIELASGETLACDVIAVQSTPIARAEFLRPLGLELEPLEMHGMSLGAQIPAEQPGGKTTVPGVFVAGNVSSIMAQVIGAATEGLMAGATCNMDLITEDTQRAVDVARTAQRGSTS